MCQVEYKAQDVDGTDWPELKTDAQSEDKSALAPDVKVRQQFVANLNHASLPTTWPPETSPVTIAREYLSWFFSRFCFHDQRTFGTILFEPVLVRFWPCRPACS